MIFKNKPAATRQDWLDQLGKRLVWYFPVLQVREILSDYREQFEAGQDRGRTEAELIDAMGTPEEVLSQLLEEEPTAKMNWLRTNGVWGAALALCLAALWVSFSFGYSLLLLAGLCIFLAAFGAVLFQLLRGPARVRLEQDFPPEQTASPVPVYCLPFLLTLAFEVTEQILCALSLAGWLPAYIGGILIAELNTLFILAAEASLALLTVWLLSRSVTRSIRYFPGVIHTVGAAGTIFFTYAYFHSTIVNSAIPLSVSLLLRLLPYFAGLAVARTFQKWVDGRRPLPFLFQARAVTRQDWLHRLGVHLLRWFPAAQAMEILEDYQEQFDLGRERGKSEEDLIVELGRPETVVRDLLAEDRKARNRRRRIWPWAAMLAAAVWLLLGVLRTYEFGGIGLFFRSPVEVSMIALVLGTAALFNLLQVQNRSAVEKKFPAQQTPAVQVALAPLLTCALVAGFSIFLIHLAFRGDVDAMFWGRPIPWYLADIIDFSVLLLLFLLIWSLTRCFSGSIRYLPAAVHVVGSMTSALCSGIFFHAMDRNYSTLEETVSDFLPALLPYAVGIVLAAGVWIVIHRKPRKEG